MVYITPVARPALPIAPKSGSSVAPKSGSRVGVEEPLLKGFPQLSLPLLRKKHLEQSSIPSREEESKVLNSFSGI